MIPAPSEMLVQTDFNMYKDEALVPYKTESWNVVIHPINLMQSPYEATIMGRGLSFHVIFGNQINGKFVCIPDRGIGAELAELKDRFWNHKSLMAVGLSEMDAHTVTVGLQAMEKYVVI